VLTKNKNAYVFIPIFQAWARGLRIDCGCLSTGGVIDLSQR